MSDRWGSRRGGIEEKREEGTLENRSSKQKAKNRVQGLKVKEEVRETGRERTRKRRTLKEACTGKVQNHRPPGSKCGKDRKATERIDEGKA